VPLSLGVIRREGDWVLLLDLARHVQALHCTLNPSCSALNGEQGRSAREKMNHEGVQERPRGVIFLSGPHT